MTATNNKPPPNMKVRLEELLLDDRANGWRSNDDLEDNIVLPECPVDGKSCFFPVSEGRGMRVPMNRKVSSSGS